MSPDMLRNLSTHLPQFFGYPCCRLLFLEGEFRMLMEIAIEVDQFRKMLLRPFPGRFAVNLLRWQRHDHDRPHPVTQRPHAWCPHD